MSAGAVGPSTVVLSNGSAEPSGGARRLVLDVQDLTVTFRARGREVRAVDGASYSVRAGETLVLIGESGSGKSVSALAAMGLLDSNAEVGGGHVYVDGEDILGLAPRERRAHLGSGVAMVFQDSLSALNPVLSVGYQIAEPLMARTSVGRRQARLDAIELMERVKIPDAATRFGHYPHQFSGGMRQRVMIAMALALKPKVLIADEPTTALDVTVQAQIMALLKGLQVEYGMGLVLVTHDLGVAAQVADRIAVMYAGKIVETGTVAAVFALPAHPYTKGLMASIPRPSSRGVPLRPIAGSPPDLGRLPEGCSFHPRCPMARDICREKEPALVEVDVAHTSACHLREDVFHDQKL